MKERFERLLTRLVGKAGAGRGAALRLRWVLLLLAVGVVVGIGQFIFSVVKNKPQVPAGAQIPVRLLELDQQPHVLGHLSGLQVSVPRSYMQHIRPYMVEYVDDTPWEARKIPIPERTLASPIRTLSFYVQLPGFKPLTRENYGDWKESVNELVPTGWIDVGFDANYQFQQDVAAMDFALNRLLQIWRNRLLDLRSATFKPEAQLVHGLTKEKPSPINDQVRDFYNRHIYYRMEGERVVTLIECGAGALSAPKGRHTCHHYFLPWSGIAIQGSFLYEPSALASWREFEDKARALLAKVSVACLPDVPKCPQEVLRATGASQKKSG